MRHSLEHVSMQVGRRSFLLGAAGALAAGLSTSLARPLISEALSAPLPAPKPILGGFDVPPLIHEFIPGPETIPFPSRSSPCKASMSSRAPSPISRA
jgi:hypothetical protein